MLRSELPGHDEKTTESVTEALLRGVFRSILTFRCSNDVKLSEYHQNYLYIVSVRGINHYI